MGNEESGLRKLVRDECDLMVHLPRPTQPPPTVASIHSKMPAFIPDKEAEESKIALNVSAATAALLARLRS